MLENSIFKKIYSLYFYRITRGIIIESPKVFISYSPTSEEYKKKIREFAKMLRSHGIDATIDEWELAGGKDINVFMEKKIRDSDKVVIACDKNYSEKANNRSGGAGIETYIISPEVYSKHDQTKYIPVIFEKDIDGIAYVPDYLKTRYYYDFTDANMKYSEEMLIRDIFGKPKYTKPPMGEVPLYISEYDEVDPKSYMNGIYSLARISRSKINSTQKNNMIKNFTVQLSGIYSDNLITYNEYKNDPVNITYKKIEIFEPLIEPYITILEAELINDSLIVNDLVLMFEEVIKYDKFLKPNENTLTDGMWDHINFSIYELFLYTVAVLKHHEKSTLLHELLHANFFGLNRFDNKKYCDFLGLNKYLPSLEVRKTALQLQRISLHADLIVERAEKTKFKSSTIVKTDLYLAYYSEIKHSYDIYNFWFPRLYIYESMFKYDEIFERLISKRYMNVFLLELGMKDKSELKAVVQRYKEDFDNKGKSNRGYSQALSSVPLLTNVLKIDLIGTID
jgi:hypothetical protein